MPHRVLETKGTTWNSDWVVMSEGRREAINKSWSSRLRDRIAERGLYPDDRGYVTLDLLFKATSERPVRTRVSAADMMHVMVNSKRCGALFDDGDYPYCL